MNSFLKPSTAFTRGTVACTGRGGNRNAVGILLSKVTSFCYTVLTRFSKFKIVNKIHKLAST